MDSLGAEHEIAGGSGAAIPLRAGMAVRLVNTHGSQVVDTWALNQADPSEYLSVEHTRRMIGKLYPTVGDRVLVQSAQRHDRSGRG